MYKNIKSNYQRTNKHDNYQKYFLFFDTRTLNIKIIKNIFQLNNLNIDKSLNNNKKRQIIYTSRL